MAAHTAGRANRPFKLLRQNSINAFRTRNAAVQRNAWREEIKKHGHGDSP